MSREQNEVPVTVAELRQLATQCAADKLRALETKAVAQISTINKKLKSAISEERTYCYFNSEYEFALAKYYTEFNIEVLESGTVMVDWTLQEMSDEGGV